MKKEKYVFLIVDCSGSINSGGVDRIGKINDLLRNAVNEVTGSDNGMVSIITYADNVKEHKELSKNQIYYELKTTDFTGRSNLGKVYKWLETYITKHSVSLADCILALISDGSATDNFEPLLKALDPSNESKRLSFALSDDIATHNIHVNFQSGLIHRDTAKFLDQIYGELQ